MTSPIFVFKISRKRLRYEQTSYFGCKPFIFIQRSCDRSPMKQFLATFGVSKADPMTGIS